MGNLNIIKKLSTLYFIATSRKLNIVQPNESKEICEKCGGACCKNAPGIATPEQFGAPDRVALFENLKDAFLTGEWVADWLEASTPIYFPRPNIIENHSGKLYDYVYHGMWGGEGTCNFLTDKGCKKEFDERPAQCQSLTPKKDYECDGGEYKGKYKMADKWRPYQREIVEAADQVKEVYL